VIAVGQRIRVLSTVPADGPVHRFIVSLANFRQELSRLAIDTAKMSTQQEAGILYGILSSSVYATNFVEYARSVDQEIILYYQGDPPPPVPSQIDCYVALQGFVNGTLQPVVFLRPGVRYEVAADGNSPYFEMHPPPNQFCRIGMYIQGHDSISFLFSWRGDGNNTRFRLPSSWSALQNRTPRFVDWPVNLEESMIGKLSEMQFQIAQENIESHIESHLPQMRSWQNAVEDAARSFNPAFCRILSCTIDVDSLLYTIRFENYNNGQHVSVTELSPVQVAKHSLGPVKLKLENFRRPRRNILSD
jgi:hypothetical protein